MKKMIIFPLMVAVVTMIVGCSEGGAYPSVNNGGNSGNATTNVQDLVGARGSSGEMALQQRGFHWVKTQKSDDSSYSYWMNSQTGECLTVRTVEGRYASLRPSPAFDCRK